MPRFLANENAPREAVLAARAAGFDVTWMVELQPGASDEIVLALAQREEERADHLRQRFWRTRLPSWQSRFARGDSASPAPALTASRERVHRDGPLPADRLA